MAIDPKLSAIAKWALEEFANGFAEAIEGMAGTRPGVTSELLSASPEPAGHEFRWKQPLSGLPGEVFALASEPDTLTTGQHVMLAAGVEDATPEELKSTIRECLGQAFSILASAMTTRLQREVTPARGQESPENPPGLYWGAVHLTVSDQSVTLFLGIPPQILDAFISEPKAVAQAAGATNNSSSSVPRSPIEDSKTFDLLLDVELPVSVSFGHAQVPLKDILKLTTGSIVELSRAVIEPVDIVVNNCVIAKGEVVVVEGNFGVRIQQVISRSERLRSLQ